MKKMISRIESNKFEHETSDIVTLYYRINKTPRTQKAYNRFKNFIRNALGFEDIQGYGDRTLMRGKGYHVNIIRSTKYFHIVATIEKNLRPYFIEAMEFFDAIQTTK